MKAEIETTGCSVRRGAVQLRISLYLDPSDPRYDEHHVQVPVIPEGENGPEWTGGEPPDENDKGACEKWHKEYRAYIAEQTEWYDSLPKVWQNNPFHNHFVQVSPDITDGEIKKIVSDTLAEFGGEWEKGNDLAQYWNHKPKKKVYAPFKVVKGVEDIVLDGLQKGKTPQEISYLLTNKAIEINQPIADH